MATLEELVVRIKADATQLERELKRVSGITRQESARMQSAVGGLAASLRGLVPALTAGALVTFSKKALDAAGRMTDLAQQIGFSAGTLSALEEGLVTTGSSLDQFASAINLMNANIGQAANDMNGPMAEAFSQLNLDIRTLTQLSPEQQFFAIAKALSGVDEQFRQTNLGRSIFGRGFANLLPIIKESNGDLATFIARQQQLGKALDDGQLAQLDELGDSISRVALTIRNELLVALNDAIEGFLKLFGLGSDPSSRQLEQRIGELKAKLASSPENTRSRDRMGNVIQSDSSLQAEIARLEGQLAVQKNYEAEKNKTTPSSGGGSQTRKTTEAERERNSIKEEGLRLTELNRTAYEKYTESVQRAGELREKKAIDEQTYQRELIRLQQELNGEITDGSAKAADQAIISAKIIKDSFGDALESVMFDFQDLGNSATSILNGIARNIARSKIIDPISSGASSFLGNLLGGGGFNNSGQAGLPWQSFGNVNPAGGIYLGSFAEGSMGLPRDGLAHVHKGEMIVPAAQSNAFRNGGGGVSVTHQWNISSGVTRQELAAMIPMIEQRSTAATLSAIEKGGRASQIVGKRA